MPDSLPPMPFSTSTHSFSKSASEPVSFGSLIEGVSSVSKLWVEMGNMIVCRLCLTVVPASSKRYREETAN